MRKRYDSAEYDPRPPRASYRSRSRSYSPSPVHRRRRYIGRRDDPVPNKCIGVFGLSMNTKEDVLREIFSGYGKLTDVVIVTDNQTQRSRGFAFCYFENLEDATNAKESLNGIEIDGRKIRVDYSITRRPHTPTPGVYMGRSSSSGRGYRPRGGGYSRGGGYPSRGRGRGGYYSYRSRSPMYNNYRDGPSRRSKYYSRSPSPHELRWYERY